MREYVVGLCIAGILFSWLPFSVHAATVLSGRDIYLLSFIAELRAELLRLQELLAERLDTELSYTPYQARLFTDPVETKYLVRNGVLYPEAGKFAREIDRQLFDLFFDTLGEEAVATYVKEWRIYHDEGGDIDAYVEQIAGSNKYVVNLNRAGFEVADTLDQEALKKLFVHEYAHMLLIQHPTTIKEYEESFWTASDKRVALSSDLQKEKYFMVHQDRFVSEYSLNSADEDMAEIFLYAIVEPAEVMYGERRDKYEFLSDLSWVQPEIVRLREQLK